MTRKSTNDEKRMNFAVKASFNNWVGTGGDLDILEQGCYEMAAYYNVHPYIVYDLVMRKYFKFKVLCD